jgi:hypothetical protein
MVWGERGAAASSAMASGSGCRGRKASNDCCRVSMPKNATAIAWIKSSAASMPTTPTTPARTKITGTICGVMMVISRPMVLQKPAPRIRISVGNNSGT